MARQRSASVLIYGILNLCFGLLFLSCNLCNFAGLVFQLATKDQPHDGTKFGGIDQEALQEHIQNKAPAYLPFIWGAGIVSFLLILVLLASGVALICNSVVGRWGTVTYCSLVLILEFTFAAYHLACVVPAANEFYRLNAGKQPPGSKEGFAAGTVIGSVGGPCVVSTFALVMLMLMLLPATGRAFARGEDESPHRRWEQEDDWGFERERRPYSEW
jgi:hypothetical protein